MKEFITILLFSIQFLILNYYFYITIPLISSLYRTFMSTESLVLLNGLNYCYNVKSRYYISNYV